MWWKARGERPHLVARLDGRQRRVEVAPGDPSRARGEARERARAAGGTGRPRRGPAGPGRPSARRPCTARSQRDLGEQLVLGVEGREGPAGPAERPVGEAEGPALELDPREARLPGQHPLRRSARGAPGSRARACCRTVAAGRPRSPLRGRDRRWPDRDSTRPKPLPAQLDRPRRSSPAAAAARRRSRRPAGAPPAPPKGTANVTIEASPPPGVPVGLGPERPSRGERLPEPLALPVAVGARRPGPRARGRPLAVRRPGGSRARGAPRGGRGPRRSPRRRRRGCPRRSAAGGGRRPSPPGPRTESASPSARVRSSIECSTSSTRLAAASVSLTASRSAAAIAIRRARVLDTATVTR